MFAKDRIRALLDLYGAQQLIVNADGDVFAQCPSHQVPIPDMGFDTDTWVEYLESKEGAEAAIAGARASTDEAGE